MSAGTTELIARAIIKRDNQILLVRRRGKSWSFLPGGHVEPGERVEAALVREIAEELGTDATVSRFAGVVEHGYIEDGSAHHEINILFDVELAAANPVSQEDHLEFSWLGLNQLADMDIRPHRVREALLAEAERSAPFWHAWDNQT